MPLRQAAGGVVVGPEKKIILVCQWGVSWSLPKGGVDEGETLLEAAVREISEETGITDLTYVQDLGSVVRYPVGKNGTGENRDWLETERTFFLFTTTQTTFASHDPHGEIAEVRWVTYDEGIELLTHEKDKEFLVSVRKEVEEAVQ